MIGLAALKVHFFWFTLCYEKDILPFPAEGLVLKPRESGGLSWSPAFNSERPILQTGSFVCLHPAVNDKNRFLLATVLQEPSGMLTPHANVDFPEPVVFR